MGRERERAVQEEAVKWAELRWRMWREASRVHLGGQQQAHYTVLKCLNSTCLKNDIKPLKDLYLSVVIVF